MYLQVTSKCNMECAHCGFSCGPRGRHMKPEIVAAGIKLAAEREGYLTIGGGEPTLHPDFLTILQDALIAYVDVSDQDLSYVGLVTNGTNRKVSLYLLALARAGVIWCRLSYDDYHDLSMVDKDVYVAFERYRWRQGGDEREGRTGSVQMSEGGIAVYKAGRGRQIIGAEQGCVCDDVVIKPSGLVKQCGCDNAPTLGHILDPTLEIEYDGMCWREVEERREEDRERELRVA